MTYRNPENFEYVTVQGNRLPMGEEGPFNVVGIKTVYLDFGEKDEKTVIQGPFRTKQVAEVWLTVYLEMYVKNAYFARPYEGWLFDPLDDGNSVG